MKRLVTIACILIQSWALANTTCDSKEIEINSSKFFKHFLTFENFGYRFKGRCRGHSLVTQKSFYLMEFGKGKNPNNCSKENFPTECQKFYYDKFSDVFFNNKVVEIPGFESLSEFSSVDYIEGLLKYHVRSEPTSFKTLEAKNRFLEKEKNPSVAHFKEAVERVQEKQKPYIAIESHWTGNHAVLGYKFIRDKKGFRLCVADPNIVPVQNRECLNYFYIGKFEKEIPAIYPATEPTIEISDEVFYHKDTEEVADRHLFKVRVYSQEDVRMNTYKKARQDYCLAQKLNL
jgi:hypothetical protein